MIAAPPGLALELEEGDALHVGRPVRGTLVVTIVDAIGPCSVLVHARLRGGHRDLVDEPAVELGPFDWEAGEARVPFELPALRGPATYVGRAVNLSWKIVAEVRTGTHTIVASTPFAIDVHRRDESGEPEEMIDAGYRDAARRPVDSFEPRVGSEHVEGPRVPKLTISERLEKALSARAAFDAVLEAAPVRVSPGATFGVTLFLYVREATTVQSATVALVHQESGPTTDTLVVAEAPLTERVDLAPGHHKLHAELEMPVGAAASFAEDGVATEWVAHAVVQAEWSAPLVLELVLTVP